jgi:hypothetical protein
VPIVVRTMARPELTRAVINPVAVNTFTSLRVLDTLECVRQPLTRVNHVPPLR